MKINKNYKCSIYYVFVFCFLISACSDIRYTYYDLDKKKAREVEIAKPSAINTAIPLTKGFDGLDHNNGITQQVVKIKKDKAKDTGIANVKPRNGTIAKKVAKVMNESLVAPLKTPAKIQAKLNAVFSEHKDTADINNTSREDWGGLIWTIIAIVLILWLLGFLVGDVGGLIHLLLVVALILIILRLLGVV